MNLIYITTKYFYKGIVDRICGIQPLILLIFIHISFMAIPLPLLNFLAIECSVENINPLPMKFWPETPESLLRTCKINYQIILALIPTEPSHYVLEYSFFQQRDLHTFHSSFSSFFGPIIVSFNNSIIYEMTVFVALLHRYICHIPRYYHSQGTVYILEVFFCLACCPSSQVCRRETSIYFTKVWRTSSQTIRQITG